MTALKTFCDIDNNIVGYAISAVTSSVDPVTCVASFGLQAEYYDTDFNVLGSSLPAGWGECCCGGSETVTTLTEDALNRTATYTNEIGAMTVLSETDFTANSQIIPGTCEGVFADADVKRELPIRWDTASNTYKAYDDGNDASVAGNNGACFPAPPIGTPTAPFTTTINNPSACKSLNVFYQYVFAPDVFTGANNLMKAHVEMSINGGPFNLHYIAYHPGLNPGGIRGYGSPHIKEATTFVVPPGGTLTLAIRGIILYDTGAAGSIFYNYCLAASFIGVTA